MHTWMSSYALLQILTFQLQFGDLFIFTLELRFEVP